MVSRLFIYKEAIHRRKQDSMMKRLFILTIKYIPIIMMIGMLGNNLLYYFEIGGDWVNLFDIFFGNSLITTFLLYIYVAIRLAYAVGIGSSLQPI